jgi:hypothetical protein
MPFALANPVRLVALVGGVAVLAAGMLVLKTTQGGAGTTAAEPKLLHTTIGAHRRPVHRHAPTRPKPVDRSPVAANGFPRAVADALVKHAVVVISVVAPRGQVDELAYREARAGAAASGAGFVRINAFRESEIAPLQAKLAISGNPALIVMRRPADVSIQINGFVDRDTIVQAVADARP